MDSVLAKQNKKEKENNTQNPELDIFFKGDKLIESFINGHNIGNISVNLDLAKLLNVFFPLSTNSVFGKQKLKRKYNETEVQITLTISKSFWTTVLNDVNINFRLNKAGVNIREIQWADGIVFLDIDHNGEKRIFFKARIECNEEEKKLFIILLENNLPQGEWPNFSEYYPNTYLEDEKLIILFNQFSSFQWSFVGENATLAVTFPFKDLLNFLHTH